MISFKKNGRPTKSEKGLLKNINNLLSSFSDDDIGRYDFANENVTESGRLGEIWDILKDSPASNSDYEDEVSVINNETVNTSTGEVVNIEEQNNIKENTKESKEDVKFVKQEDDMIDAEDATILDEIKNESTSNENAIPNSFNPLSDPIKERSYNKKQSTTVGDIEEPDFGAQPSASEELESLAEEQASEKERYEEEEEYSPYDNLTNESMNDLDPKDKKEASKQLVATVLDGYEMLHDIAKRYVQYPEEKIQEKIIKEEIDPTMAIPIDEFGNTTNVVEFFKEYNEQAAESLSYDPAFGDKVRPAMEREFARKGWGMTDWQFIGVAFAKDIGWKAMQMVTLKKSASAIMDTFVQLQREKIEAMSQSYQAPPLRPDSIVTPPPPQNYREEAGANPIYQHEHDSEDIDDTEDVDLPLDDEEIN